MRRPQEDFVGSAYLSVFTNQFWLVLTITTIVLSIMLFCFLKLEPKKEDMLLPSHSFSGWYPKTSKTKHLNPKCPKP
jgi:hypothetical protein